MSHVLIVKFNAGDDKAKAKAKKYRAPPLTDKTTLANIRRALTHDGTMKTSDYFEDADEAEVGKHLESTTLWSDVVSKDKAGRQVIWVRAVTPEVRENVPRPEYLATPDIPLPARKDYNIQLPQEDRDRFRDQHHGGRSTGDSGRNVNDLTEKELATLLKNNYLGHGLNLNASAEDARRYLVLADISLEDVECVPIDAAEISASISYSAHAKSYAESGFMEAGLTVDSPFVSGGVRGGFSNSSETGSKTSEVIVTGRYRFAKARLSFKRQQTIAPEFQRVMLDALETEDEHDKARAVQAVFDKYGQYFVTAVELGGVKYTSVTKTVKEGSSANEFKAHMEIAVGKKFGPAASAEAKLGGGFNNRSTSDDIKENEESFFNTLGGNIHTDDIAAWKTSLSDWTTWRTIRPIDPCSVLTLFDPETRDEILAAAPQPRTVPLYRSVRMNPFDHFYTADLEEHLRALAVHNYKDEGSIGRVHVSNVTGTVALYRRYIGTDHFYTTDKAEWARSGGNDEGIAGWVIEREWGEGRPGLLPLFRAYQTTCGEHFYTTDQPEYVNSCLKNGYHPEGQIGWLLPDH